MSLERDLLEVLLLPSAGQTCERLGTSSDIRGLTELAERNDLAHELFERAKAAGFDFGSSWCPPLDDGGRDGFQNAHASMLRETGAQIAAELRRQGVAVALVKGQSVADLYPPHLSRWQNDFDLATSSNEEDATSVLAALSAQGFVPQIFAVRLKDGNSCEGSISLAKLDEQAACIFWCDLWLGVQPITFGTGRCLTDEFWKSIVVDHHQVPMPSLRERLQILIDEISERSEIRYRDVIDYAAIAVSQQRSSDSPALAETSAVERVLSACIIRHADLFEVAFGAGFEFLPPPLKADKPVLPMAVTTPKGNAIEHNPFVRFRYLGSRERGKLAVSIGGERLLLRSPFGLFGSEKKATEAMLELRVDLDGVGTA